jgi:hypothetical protein
VNSREPVSVGTHVGIGTAIKKKITIQTFRMNSF